MRVGVELRHPCGKGPGTAWCWPGPSAKRAPVSLPAGPPKAFRAAWRQGEFLTAQLGILTAQLEKKIGEFEFRGGPPVYLTVRDTGKGKALDRTNGPKWSRKGSHLGCPASVTGPTPVSVSWNG